MALTVKTDDDTRGRKDVDPHGRFGGEWVKPVQAPYHMRHLAKGHPSFTLFVKTCHYAVSIERVSNDYCYSVADSEAIMNCVVVDKNTNCPSISQTMFGQIFKAKWV